MARDETDKLVHVTRDIVGVLRAAAMPEVAVPFSFRRATARAVHPADMIAIYAGDRQGRPVRFDASWALCMGLMIISFWHLPRTLPLPPNSG